MRFIFLTEEFYADYNNCKEIEEKQSRPYIQICLEINGYLFALPLRSNINHEHVFWTNKSNKCGVDFSKAIVITKEEYISNNNYPYIRPEEFKNLKGKEYLIIKQLKSYIKKYLKAKNHQQQLHNEILCKFSTLQYFEDYL